MATKKEEHISLIKLFNLRNYSKAILQDLHYLNKDCGSMIEDELASGASDTEAGYVVTVHNHATMKQAEEIIKMLLVVADLNDDGTVPYKYIKPEQR